MTGAVEVLQGVAVVEGVAEVAAEARAVAMAVAEAASVASDEVCQGAFLGSEVAGATAAGQGSAGVADSKGRPAAEAAGSPGRRVAETVEAAAEEEVGVGVAVVGMGPLDPECMTVGAGGRHPQLYARAFAAHTCSKRHRHPTHRS